MWGKWSEYTPCPVTCDGGKHQRSRLCSNPPSSNGGLNCLLSDGSSRRSKNETVQKTCNDLPCPVNGNWGEWTGFNQCSVSCGGGSHDRTRQCNNPPATNGGLRCLLSDGSGRRGKKEMEAKPCGKYGCPVNGNWGEWSLYTQCSVTCAGGSQEKVRLCDNPLAVYGGLDCMLSDGSRVRGKNESLQRACNENPCPGINLFS